jgi:aminopeptidase N
VKNIKLIIFISVILVVFTGCSKTTYKNIIIEKSEPNINTVSKLESQVRTIYTFDLQLNDEDKSIKAHESIKFVNAYNSSLKELVLHLYPDSYNSAEALPRIGEKKTPITDEELGDIKIDSLKINNTPAQYTEDDQLLKVKLPKELNPGEAIELNIEFTLKMPKGKDRLSYYQGQYSLTNWYPIMSIYSEQTNTWNENPFSPVGESNYSQCSDYKVTITVPKGMVSIATGVMLSNESSVDTDKTTFEALNSRDFVVFMSKDYKVLSKEVDGIKINSYYLKEESTAKRMLDLAAKSLNYFNNTFGKYPYPEYDVVETFLQGGAMEYPAVTQLGPYSNLSPEFTEENFTYIDQAIVHETAHQWWYSAVGNNEYEEPILDETLATYTTALFFENLFGEYGLRAVKDAFLSAPIKEAGPIYRSVDKTTWPDYTKAVYKLGPAALEDLRRKVGHEKFIHILKNYFDKYKFKNATFENFLGVVKEEAGSEVSNYARSIFTSKDYSNDKLLLPKEEAQKIRRYGTPK